MSLKFAAGVLIVVRAVISGYYGFYNLGDEAVLYSMIQALQGCGPDVQPVVLSAAPEFTAQTYGVETVNRWQPGAVISALRGADMLISGGGSLLQDVTGFKSLMYYLGVIWAARLMGKPVIFYAQGIGPVNSSWGQALVALAASRAALVTVRDEESRQDLLNMGVEKTVIVTADPVLGISPEKIPAAPGRGILEAAGVDPGRGRLVGISVRPWPGKHWPQILARVADELAHQGLQVVFLPMQHPADLEISNEVAGMMTARSRVLRQRCTVPEMLSVIGNLDFLVGMRLHSLIMAAVLGVPPVGIAYDPKVTRFLARLHIQPAATPEDLSLEAVISAAGLARTLDREDLLSRVAPLREQALEGARMALGVVEGGG